jgi:hypothetical protein
MPRYKGLLPGGALPGSEVRKPRLATIALKGSKEKRQRAAIRYYDDVLSLFYLTMLDGGGEALTRFPH